MFDEEMKAVEVRRGDVATPNGRSRKEKGRRVTQPKDFAYFVLIEPHIFRFEYKCTYTYSC